MVQLLFHHFSLAVDVGEEPMVSTLEGGHHQLLTDHPNLIMRANLGFDEDEIYLLIDY